MTRPHGAIVPWKRSALQVGHLVSVGASAIDHNEKQRPQEYAGREGPKVACLSAMSSSAILFQRSARTFSSAREILPR